MKIWHFTEQSFAPAWKEVDGPLRLYPPSSMIEPEASSALINRFLDEWCYCDEVGLNIMVNEHHSSFSSISSNVMMYLMALARQTTKARLLPLGIPLTNRMDPVRIAEEVALVDNVSRGRLELGLVKGVSWELFCSNQNPVGLMDRFWESHDLILKTLTTHDGPFSWEGRHFNYRNVNIYPRCYQQPFPQVWIPGNSANTARAAARKGYVFATFLAGHGAKDMFDAYREEYFKTFKKEASPDRLGYLGLTALGPDETTAERRALQMAPYLATLNRVPMAAKIPPGYFSANDHAKVAQIGKAGLKISVNMSNGQRLPDNASLEQLADAGMLFNGTPDQVYEQIEDFYHAVGGFGHLLSMGQAAYLPHHDTMENIRLMATEVMPRLEELVATTPRTAPPRVGAAAGG